MISVKTDSDIQKMREGGKITSYVLKVMEQMAEVGMSTMRMNDEAEKIIRSFNAIPSFKNYNGFKFATCMSIDEVVVHGFPSLRPLKEGEILSVDVGVLYQGFHTDAARTFPIGKISAQKQKLIDVTKESFFKGMEYAKSGNRLFDISSAIQEHAEKHGFSVVRTMTGHGIGKRLHEDPSIPNYGQKGTGIILKKGYAFAIEPMINLGKHEVYIDHIDKWTCKTIDSMPSAHYENTLIITDSEPEIITL